MIVITDGLLQPPPPEEGEVKYYKIFAENMEKRIDSAVKQCTFQVPAGLQAVSVSAATLYGTSPPANVSLRRSGAQISANETPNMKQYQLKQEENFGTFSHGLFRCIWDAVEGGSSC